MWILVACLVFINIVSYFSSKREKQYHDGMLFLVTIPEWAYDSIEIKEIEKQLNKEHLYALYISFATVIPLIILPSKWIFPYFMIILWFNIAIFNFPYKKAHNKLLALKKLRGWPNQKIETIKIDLSLSAYMEKHPFALKRYLLVLLIDIITLNSMIYFHSNKLMYLYLLLQFIVLGLGILIIKKLPNKTFCNNSEANITLNLLRRDCLHHCFFFMILCDSIFNLVLQLFMIEKIPFIILILIILMILICLIMTVIKANDYQNKKRQILHHYNEHEYTISNDDCWKFGFFGPTYYNKADPRTLVSIPNGTQLTFNTAKKTYQVIIISIWCFVLALLLWLFGYPYYLDINKELVDLSINEHQLIIDSPFYATTIALDDVNKIELTDNLGKGIRTNGTDAIVYSTGNYTFDRYGKCKVYTASLHHCYIILYTDNITYIVNDDDVSNTKLVYQAIKEVGLQ